MYGAEHRTSRQPLTNCKNATKIKNKTDLCSPIFAQTHSAVPRLELKAPQSAIIMANGNGCRNILLFYSPPHCSRSITPTCGCSPPRFIGKLLKATYPIQKGVAPLREGLLLDMHTLILQLFDAISLKEKRLIGKVLVILPRTRRGASWCSVDMRYTHLKKCKGQRISRSMLRSGTFSERKPRTSHYFRSVITQMCCPIGVTHADSIQQIRILSIN